MRESPCRQCRSVASALTPATLPRGEAIRRVVPAGRASYCRTRYPDPGCGVIRSLPWFYLPRSLLSIILQGAVNHRSGFANNSVLVSLALEALRVNLVDVLRSRWPRRKPATGSHQQDDLAHLPQSHTFSGPMIILLPDIFPCRFVSYLTWTHILLWAGSDTERAVTGVTSSPGQ